MLCTLPKSWDISRTANSNLNVMLLFVDVESSLHIEEMNWQNNASSKSSCALHTRSMSHRGKSDCQGASKSRGKYIECHHCGKEVHLKHECYKWKKVKGKGKKTNANGEKMKDSQSMDSNVETEAMNVVTLHVLMFSQLNSYLLLIFSLLHSTVIWCDM